MKTALPFVAALLCLVAANSEAALTGYYPSTFNTGDNLFHDPLLSTNNSVRWVFEPSTTPVGTTVSLWNPRLNAFDSVSTYQGGGIWTTNLNLPPGTGARLNAPITFQNTFVGEIVNHDGRLIEFGDSIKDPPPFDGPSGKYLLGDKLPLASSGNDIFLHVLGRSPNPGEQFITLSSTNTYLGGGAWDNVPHLGVGEAAFFKIFFQPRIDTISYQETPPSITIGFEGVSNASYHVLASTSPTFQTYTLIGLATQSLPSGKYFLTDRSITNYQSRFYRIISP